MSYDLKITGGHVVDGSGGPARTADIGVKDGRIVDVGTLNGGATRTLDADGLLVTPGFVDIHTHYDGQVSWDADLLPSSVHGVSTVVTGSCGVGFAPCHAEDRDRLVDLMQGVEDIPGTALHEGLTWDWETFPEYMASIDFPHAIDFAVQVPHDALRVYVMRGRAMANEQASPQDVEQMRAHLRMSLKAGAAGFSTGRTDNHRAADGSHTPAAEANAQELVGLAKAFHGLDHGVLQAVSDFDMTEDKGRFDAEFDVLERMVEAADGHPLSISLIQRHRDTEQWRRIVKRAEQADARGLTIRLQSGARGIGILLGLEATFHPFMGFPSYKKIAHLPLAQRVEAMRNPEFKKQLLSETTDKVAGDGSPIPPLADELLANLDFVAMKLFRLGENFSYEPPIQEALLGEALSRGVSPLEVVYDAMLEDDGKELLYFPIYNYMQGNLDVVGEMLRHPLALPGLSDGGAHVGTICDASFPTFMLTHWTRDRAKDRIPLERVVQMMTGDTAKFIGFTDRGGIAPGMRADLNIIDYENLKLERPHMVTDLPAGGQRLLQNASGYKYTLVNGEVVVQDDALTEARPGRLARLGQ